MKNHTFKAILIGAMAGLFVTACSEDALDDLTGKYTLPTPYKFTALASESVEKTDKYRIFTVDFATDGVTGSEGNYSGTGNVLSMKFVGDSYYLHAGGFTAAPAETAKKGNYIVGSGASCFYTVAGGAATAQQIVSGTLTVEKTENVYTLSGMVRLPNEEAIKVSFTGTIVYEADPEPLALTQVLYATCTSQEDGTNLIVLKLGTPEVTVIPGQYGDTYGGTGNYLSVDFVSTDPTLAAGTYTPAANGEAANGNYVKGYDTEMWGMQFYNWGTCWFTLDDGTESGKHIEAGDIVVTKAGANYTITINNGDVFAQYTGKIEALDDAEEEPLTLTNLFSASVNGNILALKIATDGITPTYMPDYYSWVYTGTGNHIAIDLYTTDGTLAAGTYTPADNTAMGEFTFAKGYDTEMWGMQFYNWGTCWFTITDGVETGEHLTGGTITITEVGGVYTINGDFGQVKVKYTGTVVIG